MTLYSYRASVVRVVDGDTVEFDIDLGFHLSMRAKMRLAKIDAPEMSTDDGKAAKAFLATYLGDTPAGVLTSHSLDKYGRILGDFLPDHSQHSVSELMVLTGHAKPYL